MISKKETIKNAAVLLDVSEESISALPRKISMQ